jgi:heat shock protein beta
VNTLRNLIKKYSQFINFPIYLWADKTVSVEEPVEDEDEPAEKKVSITCTLSQLFMR